MNDAALEELLDAEIEQEVAARWRRGDLAEMKLDDHQLRVYRKYREWEEEITAARLVESVALREAKRGVRGMVRLFVMDISRRWGKTFLVALIFIEDLIRNKGWIKTYATAYLKDIAEIIIPMIEEICSDAPPDVRPLYRGTYKGMNDVYFFPNSNSLLKLVGIDKNPRGLRGRHSDGFAITEAGRVPKLASTIGSVIYSQFMRRPKATLILESNAPDDPEHDFDRVFIPDAEARGAYVFQTIDDNTAISEDEKQEFLEAARAIDPEIADLEYYGKRIRSAKKMVCAEFADRHVVKHIERPRYFYALTSMDPGESDPVGLLWGFWDYERAKLCIVRSYAESNFRTPAVAEMVVSVEQELWGTPRVHGPQPIDQRPRHHNFHHSRGWKLEPYAEAATYWNGEMFKPNPAARVSDIDAHMLGDLAALYDVAFEKAEKSNKEAAEGAVRTAFLNDQIEILEDGCPQLIQQLKRGTWRFDREGKRVDWSRSPALGHLDCYAALIYMWRKAQHIRYLNPNPPAVVDLKAANVAAFPWHEGVKREPNDGVGRLRQALRPTRRWR